LLFNLAFVEVLLGARHHSRLGISEECNRHNPFSNGQAEGWRREKQETGTTMGNGTDRNHANKLTITKNMPCDSKENWTEPRE
jgi:hypothetical protein